MFAVTGYHFDLIIISEYSKIIVTDLALTISTLLV